MACPYPRHRACRATFKIILPAPFYCSILLVKFLFYKSNWRFGFSPCEGYFSFCAMRERPTMSGVFLYNPCKNNVVTTQPCPTQLKVSQHPKSYKSSQIGGEMVVALLLSFPRKRESIKGAL
jgi:hypothetical protein